MPLGQKRIPVLRIPALVRFAEKVAVEVIKKEELPPTPAIIDTVARETIRQVILIPVKPKGKFHWYLPWTWKFYE